MIPSSQHHSFDIALASQFGIEEAILIHHFQHWIRINCYKEKNQHEGKTWMYQSRKDIQAHFPYFTYDQVRRIAEKLCEKGILTAKPLAEDGFDKTLWYSFNDEKLFGVDADSVSKYYENQKIFTKGNSATSQTNTPELKYSLRKAKLPNREGKSANSIKDIDSLISDISKEEGEERESERENKMPSPIASKVKLNFGSVLLKQEEFEELTALMGEKAALEYVDKLNDYAQIQPAKFKKYASHCAVIRSWYRKDAAAKGSATKTQKFSNEQLAKQISLRFKEQVIRNEINLGHNYIEFAGGHTVEHIKFEDNGFQEQVLNRLRKMNLPTQGLV